MIIGRRLFLGLSLPLGVGAFLAGTRSSRIPVDREKAKKLRGSALHVEVRMTLPQNEFGIGNLIKPSFAITNRTGESITYWASGFWPNHLIVIRDAEGREPRWTPRGDQCRRAFAPGGSRRKNFPIELKPGETWEETLLSLEKLLVLKPGTYCVQTRYHDEQPPTPLNLVTPVITFKVLAR